MRWAALIVAAALCAGCKHQDAAVLVDIAGPFRIPADGDKLHIEVRDAGSGTLLIGKDWCVTVSPECASLLPPMPALSTSVTVVQSGATHAEIKINVELFLGGSVVGLGSVTTDFQPDQTVEITVPVTRP